MNGNDRYLILSVVNELVEESRFSFDYDLYNNNTKNRTTYGVNKLTTKLQMWKHFLSYRDIHPNLFYHFHPPNASLLRYLDNLKDTLLSIHCSDFDVEYYLEANLDIKIGRASCRERV